MWSLIIVFTPIVILLLVIEELIYFFWNRYVYGPNETRKVKWKSRFSKGILLLKKPFLKINRKISNAESDKSSSL